MKHLTTLLLALLVLGGCSTELDRCMKVQIEKMKCYNSITEPDKKNGELCDYKVSQIVDRGVRADEVVALKKKLAAEMCNAQGIY